tara:strand:+ start:24946 stop:26400 length:1455 start_codon:yes stop_codon:yes gene_type:complete
MKQSVTLTQGCYCGSAEKDKTLSFKGIPYAAPPVGDLRFKAPQPLSAGSESFDADHFGPACSQVSGRPKHGKGWFGGNFDEDCLYLNVFTPALDGKRRPVLFWIHGGAFILGSANLYDGSHLADQGDVVVVTINYRLGVLGFVDIGAVTEEPVPSNNGIRDIIAALRWVRDNISAFGGDPDKITISGESAGSIAVSQLLLADSARGLFNQAIMQSGSVNLMHDRAMAKATSDAYRTALDNPTLAQLQAMPVQELLEAQVNVSKLMGGAIAAYPFYDNDLLPASMDQAWETNPAPVRLMAGFTREETALFEKVPFLNSVRVDRPYLELQINRELDTKRAQDILRLYPKTTECNRALATDIYFANSTRRTAERQAKFETCWFYRFDYTHPWLGAAHGLELLFLWNMNGLLPVLARGGALTRKRLDLAHLIRESWINFVRHGNPGEHWAPFEEDGQKIMLLNLESKVVSDPIQSTRSAWKNIDITPR